jgi:hypothetical protein
VKHVGRSAAVLIAFTSLTLGFFGALNVVSVAPASAEIGDKCDINTYPDEKIPQKYLAECQGKATDSGNPATDGTDQENVDLNADGSAAPASSGNATTGTAGFNSANITTLSQWLEWIALLSCIIGICISSALWAIGSKGQNPGQELTGKKGLILCCTAAFFIGALPGMLSWLEGAARAADKTGVVGNGNIAGGTGGDAGDAAAAGAGAGESGNLNPNVNGTRQLTIRNDGSVGCGNKDIISCS